jgi:phosphohistidine phosphatase
MTARPSRRLVVLRHAKSAWPDDVADQERPLAARGRRLREMGCVPGLVACSAARRTRQTWGLVAPELGASPSVVHDPRVYDATVPALLDIGREVPDRVGTLLLIGHKTRGPRKWCGGWPAERRGTRCNGRGPNSLPRRSRS